MCAAGPPIAERLHASSVSSGGERPGILSDRHCDDGGRGRPPPRTAVALKHTAANLPRDCWFTFHKGESSAAVRCSLSTKFMSFQMQWRAEATGSLRQVSLPWATIYDPQRQRLLEENNVEGSSFRFTVTEAQGICHCTRRFPPTHPMTLNCLGTEAAGLNAALPSVFAIGETGLPRPVWFWDSCLPILGVWYCIVPRMLTQKPP